MTVLRVNHVGAIEWQHSLRDLRNGTNAVNIPGQVIISPDGTVVATGGFAFCLSTSGSCFTGIRRAGLLEISEGGQILRQKVWALQSESSSSSVLTDVTPAPDGGLFVIGSGAIPNQEAQFIARLDSARNVIWSKLISLSGKYPYFANQARISSNGLGLNVAMFAAANTSGPIDVRHYVLRFTDSGDVQWQRSFSPGPQPIAIKASTAGKVYFSSRGLGDPNVSQSSIIRLSGLGLFEAAVHVDGATQAEPLVKEDGSVNVIVGNEFAGFAMAAITNQFALESTQPLDWRFQSGTRQVKSFSKLVSHPLGSLAVGLAKSEHASQQPLLAIYPPGGTPETHCDAPSPAPTVAVSNTPVVLGLANFALVDVPLVSVNRQLSEIAEYVKTDDALCPSPPSARLVITPDPLYFNSVGVGICASKNVRVTNIGNAPGVVSGVTAIGDPQFSVAADGCSTFSLGPTVWCDVSVQFCRSVAGTAQSNLEVAYNGKNSFPAVSLMTAVDETPFPALFANGFEGQQVEVYQAVVNNLPPGTIWIESGAETREITLGSKGPPISLLVTRPVERVIALDSTDRIIGLTWPKAGAINFDDNASAEALILSSPMLPMMSEVQATTLLAALRVSQPISYQTLLNFVKTTDDVSELTEAAADALADLWAEGVRRQLAVTPAKRIDGPQTLLLVKQASGSYEFASKVNADVLVKIQRLPQSGYPDAPSLAASNTPLPVLDEMVVFLEDEWVPVSIRAALVAEIIDRIAPSSIVVASPELVANARALRTTMGSSGSTLFTSVQNQQILAINISKAFVETISALAALSPISPTCLNELRQSTAERAAFEAQNLVLSGGNSSTTLFTATISALRGALELSPCLARKGARQLLIKTLGRAAARFASQVGVYLDVAQASLTASNAVVRLAAMARYYGRTETLIVQRDAEIDVGSFNLNGRANSSFDRWQYSVHIRLTESLPSTSAVTFECSNCRIPRTRLVTSELPGPGEVLANFSVFALPSGAEFSAPDGNATALCGQLGVHTSASSLDYGFLNRRICIPFMRAGVWRASASEGSGSILSSQMRRMSNSPNWLSSGEFLGVPASYTQIVDISTLYRGRNHVGSAFPPVCTSPTDYYYFYEHTRTNVGEGTNVTLSVTDNYCSTTPTHFGLTYSIPNHGWLTDATVGFTAAELSVTPSDPVSKVSR